MNEEFIPYEEALALKELDFNEECFRFYHTDKFLREISDGWYNIKCSAPLYQQAFKFFRKKYMLSGAILPATVNHSNNTMEYTYDIRGKYTTSVLVGSYEDAELECLKKLIIIAKELSNK